MIRTDVFDTIENLAGGATTAVLIVVSLLALIVFAITAWKGKTLAAVVSGGLMALFLIWVANNITNDDLQRQISDTIVPDGAPAHPGPTWSRDV